MIASLDPGQGRMLRALGIYLSEGCKGSVRSGTNRYGFVVLSLHSAAWASLTFVGERHRIAVRLPAGTAERPIDPTALAVHERIVAVERAVWTRDAHGVVLALDLLAIDESAETRASA